MKFNLTLPFDNEIEAKDKNIIQEFIINNIDEYENNSSKLTELIMEAVASLSAGKARTDFIASQGFFKNLLYSITGQNRKIRGEIDYNYAIVKNASVRMIEYLAGQNKITYEGLIYLNNKLNNIERDLEEEIIIICKNIRESFNFILNKIEEESKRIDAIEKKVRLLEYKASCKLLEFNYIKYSDMDDIEKIICLSGDLFFEIYYNDLPKENIFVIKSILLDLNLDSNEKIKIIDLYKKLIEKPEFMEKLFFNEFNIEFNITENKIPNYITPILSGVNKIKKLNNEENYILSYILKLKNLNNETSEINEIKINLINEYAANELDFDYNSKIGIYEIIIMIINELKMIANQNNNSIKNVSLSDSIKIMNKYYSSKEFIKAIVEADNILTIEKNNIKAHNIKMESVYKLLINETKNFKTCNKNNKDNKNNENKNYDKKEYYKDIAKIYLIKEDYDNAFKYLNKYCENRLDDKNIIKLKKKLKEQYNKIKKYKEISDNKFGKKFEKIIIEKNKEKNIKGKIIKNTNKNKIKTKTKNKNKKEYLDFINSFWTLYLSDI